MCIGIFGQFVKIKSKKKIIDLQVFYLIYQKSLNVACMTNLKVILISNCQNISVDLEMSLAHNTAN